MGAKLSKAGRERPHVDNELPGATSFHRENLQMGGEPRLRQETCYPGTKEGTTLANDSAEDGVATTSTAPDNCPSNHGIDDDDRMEIDQLRRASTGSRTAALLDELQELPGDIADDEPTPLPQAPEGYEPPPPPAKICLICTVTFDDESKAIQPCKCNNDYCASCLKEMFLDACKDWTRMPPRCCTILPIHYVRPYLSKEEAALFRAKFEEWNTPKPFYCPVARCSIFISNRLLPQTRANSKETQRMDSDVETPPSPTIFCPACETELCTNCRSLAHAGGTCEPLEFGIDKETAELLKIWGYKNCPKCGNGVKRMYGCAHMQCLCSAQFCWYCLRSHDECCGDCGEGDDDDCSYGGPDHDDDEEPATPADSEQSGPEPEPVARTVDLASSTNSLTSAKSTDLPPEPTPRRPRNLDGGSADFWEDQGLDFGEEPTENRKDRTWDCDHRFETAKLKLADSLRRLPSETAMECMKCWCTIYPEVEVPRNVHTGRARWASAGIRSAWGGSIRRSSGRGQRAHDRTRARVTMGQPVEFAHSVPELGVMSQSVPNTESMEDIQFTSSRDRILDTYGNTITTKSQPTDHRRFSLDSLDTDRLPDPLAPGKAAPKASSLSVDSDALPFKFAFNCEDCGLIVCSSCKMDFRTARLA